MFSSQSAQFPVFFLNIRDSKGVPGLIPVVSWSSYEHKPQEVLQAEFPSHFHHHPRSTTTGLLSCPIDTSEAKNPWAVESRSLSARLTFNHPASNFCERASMSSWYQTCASSMPAEAPEFCGWIYRWDVWFLAGPLQLALIRGSLWDEGGRFCPWLLCARWEFVLKRKMTTHQSGERQDDKGVTPKPDFYSIVESSHPRSFALKSHLLSLMNPSTQLWLKWYYLFRWECHDSQFKRGMWDL